MTIKDSALAERHGIIIMSDNDVYSSSMLFRIRGDIVATAEDAHGEVTVIDNKVYRLLSFDRVFEQSKMQKSNPAIPVHKYICAMLMATALTPAKRVLVLGLGGGCLIRPLFAENPQIAMDIVELRQAVMDVALAHFHLPVTADIHYRIDDAAHFMAQAAPSRYSLIFSDLYSASAIVPLQSSREFLRQCAQALQSDGWLVLNHPQAPDEDSAFSNALTTLFRTVLYCTTPSGNVVIYASPGHCSTPLTQLRTMMKASGERYQSDFSLLAHKIYRWPGQQA